MSFGWLHLTEWWRWHSSSNFRTIWSPSQMLLRWGFRFVKALDVLFSVSHHHWAEHTEEKWITPAVARLLCELWDALGKPFFSVFGIRLKQSTTGTTPRFFYFIFQIGSHDFLCASLRPRSSYLCLLPSWDTRLELLSPGAHCCYSS
jgi:hypothetical protein